MNYAGMTRGNAPARIDMRSDTVTRPTDGMRAAMMAAEVGDDVYGDDPTVNALQDKVAAMLGKEAALFLSSGTQSNLCAMLGHCARGEEILTGSEYHVFIDEAGGASVLGGIMFAPMPIAADGSLDPDDIDRTVKPDDEHCPISTLLTLENTWHGQVIPVDKIHAAAQCGKKHGPVFLAALRRRVNLVDRDDLAVPGVFQRQQRRNRAMFIIRLDGPVNVIRVETAICGDRHRGKHDPAKHRRAASLVDKDVIFAAGQNFLAARAMAQHGTQIGLGAARQEQRRFLAKHRRHLVLKRIYCRIVTIDIVTNLGRGW